MDSQAERLRYLRGETDQGEFAERVGVSQSLISAIEKGSRRITADLALKLNERMGVSIDWILRGEGQPYRKEGLIEEETAVYPLKCLIPIAPRGALSGENILKEGTWRDMVDIGGTLAYSIEEESSLLGLRMVRVLCRVKPKPKNGDLVIVKRMGGSQDLFRRMYRDLDKDAYVFEGVNPAVPRKPVILKETEIQYMYRVIGIIWGE